MATEFQSAVLILGLDAAVSSFGVPASAGSAPNRLKPELQTEQPPAKMRTAEFQLNTTPSRTERIRQKVQMRRAASFHREQCQGLPVLNEDAVARDERVGVGFRFRDFDAGQFIVFLVARFQHD